MVSARTGRSAASAGLMRCWNSRVESFTSYDYKIKMGTHWPLMATMRLRSAPAPQTAIVQNPGEQPRQSGSDRGTAPFNAIVLPRFSTSAGGNIFTRIKTRPMESQANTEAVNLRSAVPYPLTQYYQGIKQLSDSIEDCLSKGRVLSCLVLLYSAIDIFASLERNRSESTKDAFVRWVDTYMLPNSALQFSAIDLYAARCGIVHAFSAESDLSRDGRAKKLVYAWGTATADSLRKAGKALGRTEIGVHVRDLVYGFNHALIKYIDDVADSPAEHEPFFHSVAKWLVGVDSSAFDVLVRASEQTSL
jgi:hypothetical protein